MLVSCARCQEVDNTDQQRTVATENARKITASLYDLLRGIAFPQSPTLDTQATNENNRFVLLMPGKVLNYFDYYPGKDYTKFIQVGARAKLDYITVIVCVMCNMAHNGKEYLGLH